MALPSARSVGNTSLVLSLLVFGVFFLNVLIGGPLGRKPWMGDVLEMLTLFAAVILFVAGTLAREADANHAPPGGSADPDQPEREPRPTT